MKTLAWFDRKMTFGLPTEMLPFYLERLSGTAIRIEQKVESLDNKFLSERFDDKWSIKQHIGHLAEVDQINNKRIDEMIAGAAVLSAAVFEPQDYNPWPVEKVITFFREGRARNILKYTSLPEADLTKSSLHPRLKIQTTPIDLAWFDAEHDDHHLVKINEIIQRHVHA
jgi:DinB superfamily